MHCIYIGGNKIENMCHDMLLLHNLSKRKRQQEVVLGKYQLKFVKQSIGINYKR